MDMRMLDYFEGHENSIGLDAYKGAFHRATRRAEDHNCGKADESCPIHYTMAALLEIIAERSGVFEEGGE